jgi:riboflavin kinase/FMN adenylyltransferase
MELIRGQHNLRPRHHGCVATIGNFDGVHLGHARVMEQVLERARALALPSAVITFEPLPHEYFVGAERPARLTGLRDKVIVLESLGIERVLCLRFDHRLATMEADAFIDRLLVAGLGIRFLVVGDDFRFGKGRIGDFAMLKGAGAKHGFEVTHTQTYIVDGERVSSTRIRAALDAGDMALARRLLGRPYRICGRITHGDKLGRGLGYATANIRLDHHSTPVHGIYVVEVEGVADRPLPGVASIGTRPTVGGTLKQLEVHLFDFDRDIYGRHINVGLLHRLRDEQRFESLDALKLQMAVDLEHAREYFRTHSNRQVV